MRRAILASAVLLLATAAVRAGDAKGDHIQWRHTYGAALFEARVRNMPVLLTRQKDG
jgi:hypothetical protein